MLKVYIGTASNPDVDYTRYVVDQSLVITKSINVPTTCSLTLSNVDGNFTLPAERSYIRIYSTQYQRSLFTGFLTNDPARSFLGIGTNSSYGQQLYNFNCAFTSDEYLLNIKNVGFIPTFVNQGKGQILQVIAETLCPGFYDFTYCASGDIVPSFTYDPTQSWSELAKTLGDGSRYRYSAIDKEIHFQPYGDGALGIGYDESLGQGTFDPFSLATAATTTPIVNDVTVIGQQEAGNNHEDNFIGTGFVGAFPLKHKIFGLADAQAGNAILLSDSWNESAINTQNWTAQDPSNNFFYGADNSQALNILTGVAQPPGTSFIAAYNALELAGGVVLQHGEFVFNDVSYGVLGGVYDSTALNGFNNLTIDEAKCECGFIVAPTANVTVTASGAAGISIQPFRQGATPAKAFNVLTKVNCSYVLTTSITAPAPSRYTQTYRTLAGVAYGGTQSTDVLGNITWSVIETNLFTGVQNTYTFSLANQSLPATAIYVLIDNYQLNITVTTTSLSAPIPGSLNATCEVGAGLLAPIYVSGLVQYTGAFVTPSGGNLPILPGNFGPENNFALGTSLQNQAAEVDSGQVVDTLNFYGDDLPGVGVRVRLQTWESQAAVSRVQDPVSVAIEAAVVGDNGIRSAIVTNLNPLPRTSEDCDFAGQAFLNDRTQPFYQGTYNASWLFFSPVTNDIEFYPTCGRYLYINSPKRNINKQNFVVTAVTTTVTELYGERMDHSITFGPDLYLDKLLAALVPLTGTSSGGVNSVLMPSDTVVQPPPQSLSSIGSNYLPDVQQTTAASLAISGAAFTLSLNDIVPNGAWYEIRDADLNWGILTDGRLIAQVFTSGDIVLPRAAYDEDWYIRLVTIINGEVISSRRTKVIRIVYPRVPLIPAYVRSDSSEIYLDFNGDIRNIEGVELRGTVQSWTASTLFTSTEQIIDTNGNVQQVISAAAFIVASSSIVPGPSGAAYNYANIYLANPLPIIGGLYSGQNVGFSGLNGPHGQLVVMNDEPFDIWPILVLNPQLLQIAVFGVLTGGIVAENANVQSKGTPPGSISDTNEPIWNTNSINVSGSVVTQDGGILWANLGMITPSQPVYYQAIVGSEFDMDLQLGILRGQLTPGQTSTGPIGQFQVNLVPPGARSFIAYFFNLMWEYGPGLSIYIPPPQAPTLTVGYSFGSSLQLNISPNDPVARLDIAYTNVEISNDVTFDSTGVIASSQSTGSIGSVTLNVPVTGTLYARAQLVDQISSGAWSSTLVIPQGNLISSAYLAGQGSVPPAITTSANTSGGLFTYTSTSSSVTMASVGFSVIYPNGALDNVPATMQTFSTAIDSPGPLQASTTYGFFPSLKGPTTATPTIEFNGPYLNYTTTGVTQALAAQQSDGSVPITNGSFAVATAAGGGSSGGGGGGTGGGGNCAEVSRKILCSDGAWRSLLDVSVGQLVKNGAGRLSKIIEKKIFLERTVFYKTKSGLETETAYGHVLYCKGYWQTLASLMDVDDLHDVTVKTTLEDNDMLVELLVGKEQRYICKLALAPIDKNKSTDDDHVYNLDGFWSHNGIIKNSGAI